jgi:hypothetical protein
MGPSDRCFSHDPWGLTCERHDHHAPAKRRHLSHFPATTPDTTVFRSHRSLLCPGSRKLVIRSMSRLQPLSPYRCRKPVYYEVPSGARAFLR